MLGMNTAKRTAKTEGVEPFPLRLPNQQVALVQIAHRELQCSTKNGRAGVRILGIFDKESKAKKHFKKCIKRGLIEPLPAFVVDLFETHVIPNNKSRTVEYLAAKAKTLKEQNKVEMEERQQKFKDKLEKRRTGELDTKEEVLDMMRFNDELKKKEQQEQIDEEESDDDDDVDIKRDAQIRSQNVVAISYILDKSEEQEDAFTIYAAFDRHDEAARYVKDTLSDYENSVHLFVNDMYEWLFPYFIEEPGMLKKIPFSYQHAHLNDFMQNQASQKDRVAAYKKALEEISSATIKEENTVEDEAVVRDDEQKN